VVRSFDDGLHPIRDCENGGALSLTTVSEGVSGYAEVTRYKWRPWIAANERSDKGTCSVAAIADFTH